MVKVVQAAAGVSSRLVLPVFQDSPEPPLAKGIGATALRMAERAFAEKLFRGEAGEPMVLIPPGKGDGPALVLLGLGAEKKLTLEGLRRALGSLARRLRRERVKRAQLLLDAPGVAAAFAKLGWEKVITEATLSWELGSYAFDAYKTGPGDRKSPCSLEIRGPGNPSNLAGASRKGRAIGEAVNWVRELANTPANDLSPEDLAAQGRKLARSAGLRCRVLGKRDIEREKMGALLGVAGGSDRPPRLIVLEHRAGRKGRGGRAAPTVALVGKAITFDCGGLSIKPAKGMEEMKFDMSGGAAVMGILRAAAELDLPVNLVGIVPAAENAIGGSAMRPGDILRSASGKTIEVLNTDAEGRLILADALHYAQRFHPDYVVDFATLTGACLVALGTQVSGMVTNDRQLGRSLFEAGERSGERVWELPLYEEFLEATKSQVADLKNSAGRNGGAITAGAFLSYFVGKTRWCHLDIAGTAWVERESGCFTVGATGVGVRLLIEFLDALSS